MSTPAAPRVQVPRLSDRAGSAYARPHPAFPPPPCADPGANRMDAPENWVHDFQPRRAVAVPPGHLAVQVTNGTSTSAGNHQPGDVAVLPDAEARELLRQGLARPVVATG